MSYNSVNNTKNSLDKFEDFIKYLIDNSEELGGGIYESITNISKSDFTDDGSKTLVESKLNMINLDNVCTFAYTKDNGRCNSKPLSVDALYLYKKKSILYLIEFKNDTFDRDYKKELSKFIKDNEDNFDVSLLKKVNETYVNEIDYKLKYKPLESILLVLPKAYEKYCKLSERSIEDLYSFLINDIKIHLLVVIKRSRNNTGQVLNRGDLTKKLQKINHFEHIINNWQVMDEKDFEKFISKRC